MITFPTTPEAFIAYQEAGTGRPLTDTERELMEASVGIMNECFHSGKAGEKKPWPESTEEVIDTLREMGDVEKFAKDPLLVHYIAFMLTWTNDAYHQGKETQVSALRQIRDDLNTTPEAH